ncbi:MAG: M20/M25/M40 family metallo-hydrolase, partial [Actinomycetota bacterium]
MTHLTLSDFERDALPTLTQYASIPCLSPAFDAAWSENGYIDQAMELLANWVREREFNDVEIEIHRIEGRTPLMTVTIGATNPGEGTCVLYGHMDKQPPLGDWSEGLAPYQPVRRGDRLYARGVADDGYSTFAAILALEAMEREGIGHSRCVVLIEASEESGSPDLDAYLDLLKAQLGRVELMICLDSGALTYDRLWVTTSLRGVINIELTVSVLEYGQHSGSASGVIPSSFRILRQLLERVEDSSTGDILVPELYGEIPEYVKDSAEE